MHKREGCTMNGKTPHIVQYQGSKRLLAPQIIQYMPSKFNRLIEPFSGMAAITIATAKGNRAMKYHINDINEPVMRILETAINNPTLLVDKYTALWNSQFSCNGGHIEHFFNVRDRFNEGEQTAENMLYLIARCVKGSVRYAKNGNFNQSLDKRRHGTNPKNMSANIYAISSILKGKTVFSSCDYRTILETAKQGDLIYLDPPYQGVTNAKDHRYLCGIGFDAFSESIATLDQKGIDYIISYDGECGKKSYGKKLPNDLNCTRYVLNAGVSAQATLLGKKSTTFESLYVSNSIVKDVKHILPHQITLMEPAI